MIVTLGGEREVFAYACCSGHDFGCGALDLLTAFDSKACRFGDSRGSPFAGRLIAKKQGFGKVAKLTPFPIL